MFYRKFFSQGFDMRKMSPGDSNGASSSGGGGRAAGSSKPSHSSSNDLPFSAPSGGNVPF